MHAYLVGFVKTLENDISDEEALTLLTEIRSQFHVTFGGKSKPRHSTRPVKLCHGASIEHDGTDHHHAHIYVYINGVHAYVCMLPRVSKFYCIHACEYAHVVRTFAL